MDSHTHTKLGLSGPLLGPWAITAEGFAHVREHALHALQVREGKPLANAKRASVRNGVCVIPVQGPLSKSPSWFSAFLGGSDYETIAKDLRSALDSPEVKAILFDIDSPGGEVAGVAELSAMVYAARAIKPSVAYVSGMCASAAYWIGSAAGEIVGDRASLEGSIGVRTMLVDTSKAEEKAGIAVYDEVSDQSPYKVVDASKQADRDRVKATMTALAEVFIGDVARNRGITSDRVKSDFGKGDVMVADSARKAGLIDRVGDFESTLALLSASASSPQYLGAKSMSVKAGMKAAKCDGCERDMDDDDELYCRACHGDHDAKGDLSTVLASTGKVTRAEQIAVIQGWKDSAAEVTALRAALKAQEDAAATAKFEATVKEFRDAGIIPPSADHKRSLFVAGLRGKPDAAAQVRAYCETLEPLVPGKATAVEPSPTAVAEMAGAKNIKVALTDAEKKAYSVYAIDGALIALDSTDIAAAQRYGLTLEAYAKTKALHEAKLRARGAGAMSTRFDAADEDDKDAA